MSYLLGVILMIKYYFIVKLGLLFLPFMRNPKITKIISKFESFCFWMGHSHGNILQFAFIFRSLYVLEWIPHFYNSISSDYGRFTCFFFLLCFKSALILYITSQESSRHSQIIFTLTSSIYHIKTCLINLVETRVSLCGPATVWPWKFLKCRTRHPQTQNVLFFNLLHSGILCLCHSPNHQQIFILPLLFLKI